MKRLFTVIALCLPLLAVASCSVNPATGKQSFTGFVSRADEMTLGKNEHPKILKSFGGQYKDTEIDAYVRRIGLNLTKVSEVPDLPYTLTVLNDEKVNAFAVPGGYIYITRGLLALAENEAEMAGVLAHEIGHITARHSAQRYSKAQATNLGLTLIGILGSASGVSAPGVNNLLSVVAQVALQSYSREQEMEADMLGVRYLTRAGYSPEAMISFLQKMQAHTKLEATLSGNPELANRSSNIMSTHPRTADRIVKAIELAKAVPQASPRFDRQEYLTRIDGLMFGDDPEQGIRKGRVFAHAELGIQFEVPPGFVLFNSPSKVLARGPNGSVIIFDMERAQKAQKVESLKAYVLNSWGDGLSLREIEKIDVNNLEGATGRGRLRMKDGSLKDIRLLAIRENADRIYRFAFLTPPAFTVRMATDFQRTSYSFRRLSPDEVASIRPLRLRVVTVTEDDTAASLAADMPFEKGGLEWFEVLNGLTRGQPLISGEKVKTVGD